MMEVGSNPHEAASADVEKHNVHKKTDAAHAIRRSVVFEVAIHFKTADLFFYFSRQSKATA